MLTIQPNFTNQSYRKVPAFKAAQDNSTPEDEIYESKTNYYESKKQEFENLANKAETPKSLKDIANVFKIVSTMFLEGWAVAWGTRKGANFVKSSVVEGASSDVAKGTKNILKPIGKGFVAAGKKIAEYAAEGIKYIKGTSLYIKANKGIESIVEKMNTNKVGRFVLNVLGKISNGVKAAFNLAAKPFKKVAEKVKTTSFDEAYDKTAKAASSTLGVGAGAASGYTEIMHPEKTKVEEKENEKKVTENNDDVENLDEEEEE